MDFQLTPEQKELQQVARTFAREQMPAVAAACEETGEPPDASVMARLGEMGFLGINIAPEYGGLGLGNLEALLVLEEF
ncbi:MAG: acyl-CoA dehydrogenase family protein, partial [Alphaproteobacteria bacterium]|nr:acyl-CoA dehydrogenase family protein [Alphaproteobacteria bacterium]